MHWASSSCSSAYTFSFLQYLALFWLSLILKSILSWLLISSVVFIIRAKRLLLKYVHMVSIYTHCVLYVPGPLIESYLILLVVGSDKVIITFFHGFNGTRKNNKTCVVSIILPNALPTILHNFNKWSWIHNNLNNVGAIRTLSQ